MNLSDTIDQIVLLIERISTEEEEIQQMVREYATTLDTIKMGHLHWNLAHLGGSTVDIIRDLKRLKNNLEKYAGTAI